MTFWRTYYHMVWATRRREPIINRDAEASIRRSIQSIASDSRVLVHAIGMMPEHVHVVVSIPPRIAVAEFAKLVKGGTSHLVNRSIEQPIGDWFAWQPEYGVLTFGERSLERVISYAENQASHHAANRLWSAFERIDEEHRPATIPRPGGTS